MRHIRPPVLIATGLPSPGARDRGPRPASALRASSVLAAAMALLAGLAPVAGAYPRPGTIERVSIGFGGSEGNLASSTPAISADGRYVAFTSIADNLVPGDSNLVWDIFVRHRAAGTIERVSVGPGGVQAASAPYAPAISADGRYVAFSSGDHRLISGDTNGAFDIFVRDRNAEAPERVSVASGGGQANGRSQYAPAISADGRYVAFGTLATNLVPDDTNGAQDVFVHDRTTRTTERVSVASGGAQSNGASPSGQYGPAISADGRYVAFTSAATNLVAGDTNRTNDVFVHDRATGTTQRVSVRSGGGEANDDSGRYTPAISADGRYVAFTSAASNLVPADVNAAPDGFVHDRATGTTQRVSVGSAGAEGNAGSQDVALSADGRYVAFRSDASNLVPGDDHATRDLFVHDLSSRATEWVATSPSGDAVLGVTLNAPAITPDGRFVAFASTSPSVVPGDTNNADDVFVRHRGPAAGPGSLSVDEDPGRLTVSGWTRLAHAPVSSVSDPDNDGQATGPVTAGDRGAELTGASVTYRPEEEDVLFRLSVASFPAPSAAALPSVLYGMELRASGVKYEVRVMRASATAVPPAAPYFGLYRCTPACEETAVLSGGIGTTNGNDILVSVPAGALGAPGAVVQGIRAFTATGEAATGTAQVLDEAALPDGSLPVARVDLGIAPPAKPQDEVSFTAPAGVIAGQYSGTITTSGLPAGDHRVWVRTCVASTCDAASVLVRL